jgi:N-methylhydantoinase A
VDLLRAFEEKYEFTYGRDTAYRDAGIELTTLRVVGRVPTGRYGQSSNGAVHTGAPEPYLWRRAYFRAAGGFVETPCFRGEDLRTGHSFAGPAIIERMGDTVVIPTGTTASVDHVGNLILRV